MYSRKCFFPKNKQAKYWLNLLALSVVIIFKTYFFATFTSTAFQFTVRKQLRFQSTRFFICSTSKSNTWLKLAKNQAKAKQHPETELMLIENYSNSSFMLSPKTNILRNVQKASVSVLMRLCD